MKNHIRKELIGRSVLVVALVAVGISGTGLLLSFPIPTILGNTPRLVSNAFGASDSVFGDATTSTTSNNDNDNPEDDSTNTNNDQINEKDQTSEETTTTSSSNIAPQISSGSDNSQASESSSGDSTTSSPPKIYNASMIGIKKDKSYDPNPININAGDTVVWTNSDNDIHSVTSGGDEGPSIGQEFDSGIIGSGKSFTHKFENLGTYEYFCSMHPPMVGEVIVK